MQHVVFCMLTTFVPQWRRLRHRPCDRQEDIWEAKEELSNNEEVSDLAQAVSVGSSHGKWALAPQKKASLYIPLQFTNR